VTLVEAGQAVSRADLAEVRLALRRPPDLIVRRPGIHENTPGPIQQRRPSRRIQSQGVALDDVADGLGPEELDTYRGCPR